MKIGYQLKQVRERLAKGLVDKGILTDTDYRDFVFTYPAQLHLKANPEFFANTAIASSVTKLDPPLLVPLPSKEKG